MTTVQLTREQANKAIEMCLQNAKSFLEDAKMNIKNRKTDHLSIPIVYSLEEIGKAKMIQDAMSTNSDNIILEYDPRTYHEKKLSRAVEILDVPFADRFQIDMLFDMEEWMGTSSMAISATENDRTKLKNIANSTHNLRKKTAFVNFDSNTNEPYLETDNSELIPLIQSISELIDDFHNNKQYPNDFSMDDVKKFPV